MDEEEIRRSIEALIHDYAHAIDDDRLEEWPDFFTEDCVYRVIPRESHEQGLPVGFMVCAGRGMLQDRIHALRTANIYEPHRYRHLVSAVRIRGRSGGLHRVETGFAVIRVMQNGESGVFLSGKYVDEIVFRAGSPRFRQRIVVCDSDRIDTLIVIPP